MNITGRTGGAPAGETGYSVWISSRSIFHLRILLTELSSRFSVIVPFLTASVTDSVLLCKIPCAEHVVSGEYRGNGAVSVR